MATGIPVLSTRHSGIPELVADGRSGILVPERDVDALAQALRSLLQDRPRWPEMGRHGRAAVAAGFSRQQLDDERVEAYYRSAGRAMRQPATDSPKRS
jgi:colanic acid/amylovoran biosynthesis glycosyltransferase